MQAEVIIVEQKEEISSVFVNKSTISSRSWFAEKSIELSQEPVPISIYEWLKDVEFSQVEVRDLFAHEKVIDETEASREKNALFFHQCLVQIRDMNIMHVPFLEYCIESMQRNKMHEYCGAISTRLFNITRMRTYSELDIFTNEFADLLNAKIVQIYLAYKAFPDSFLLVDSAYFEFNPQIVSWSLLRDEYNRIAYLGRQFWYAMAHKANLEVSELSLVQKILEEEIDIHEYAAARSIILSEVINKGQIKTQMSWLAQKAFSTIICKLSCRKFVGQRHNKLITNGKQFLRTDSP